MSLLNMAADLFLNQLGRKGESVDLAAAAQSWLGDGANQSLGALDIKRLLGAEPAAEFGDKVGVDTGTAVEGLAGMLPTLLDKSSEGGSLLGSVVCSGTGSLLKGLF